MGIFAILAILAIAVSQTSKKTTTPGNAATPTPVGNGLPGGIGSTRASNVPTGNTGPRTATGNTGIVPPSITSDAACFNGPMRTGVDDDISGLPASYRGLYEDALNTRPAFISNFNRDDVALMLDNLGHCLETRGFLKGAQRFYTRAAEVRSGIHDGNFGGPYQTVTSTFPPLPSAPPTLPTNGGGVTSPVFAPSPGGGGGSAPIYGGVPGGLPGVISIGPGVVIPGAIATAVLLPDNILERDIAAIPDDPPGSGIKSQVRTILQLFRSWKAPWTSFPFGDPDYLRNRANAIESAYGATRAANSLREIATRVEAAYAANDVANAEARREARAASDWPGLWSITDPSLQPLARQLARGLHPFLAEDVFGLLVPNLSPVNGFVLPTTAEVQQLLTNITTLYPSLTGARNDILRIVGALLANRIGGNFDE